MVAPTQADIIEAEEEMAAAEAPPLPTMADVAPQGFIDAPEEEMEALTPDEVPEGGM